MTLVFSYETLVGVEGVGFQIVSQNDWSTTTGKLLNKLEPDKKARVPHDEVLKAAVFHLKRVLGGLENGR